MEVIQQSEKTGGIYWKEAYWLTGASFWEFINIEDSEIFDKLINLWKFIVPAHSSHIYRPGFRLWHRLTHVLWITMDTWAVPHSSPQLSQWDTISISPRSRHEPGGDNAEPLQVKTNTNGSWGNLPVQHTPLNSPSSPVGRLEHVTQTLANHSIPFPWPQHWSRQRHMTQLEPIRVPP